MASGLAINVHLRSPSEHMDHRNWWNAVSTLLSVLLLWRCFMSAFSTSLRLDMVLLYDRSTPGPISISPLFFREKSIH